jgi:hypothetical protein
MVRKDDKPSGVVGTISKTVQQYKIWFRRRHVKLEEMTQPGWGDVADYYWERVRQYATTKLKVLMVINA